MTEYCTNEDLVKVRPAILDLGVADWATQILKAGVEIDRSVESLWYRRNAEDTSIDWRVTPFDRALLLNAVEQLTTLGVYKSLEHIYLYLMKHSSQDVFKGEMETFRDRYKVELKEVLLFGLDYDWDQDGTVDPAESKVRETRRLSRV